MKQIFLASIFMCFFLSFNAISQTYVSGSVHGTWTKANSPYIVTDDLLIDSGNSLFIERGVQVQFNGYFEVEVKGTLRAEGTEADSIIFTVRNSNTTWNGFYFDNSDSMAIFKYCRIEYASADRSAKDSWRDYNGGAVFCYETDLLFENCYFRYNNSDDDGGAIYASMASGALYEMKIVNCTFQDNSSQQYGGAICAYFNLQVLNSTFERNTTGYEGGALSCSEG